MEVYAEVPPPHHHHQANTSPTIYLPVLYRLTTNIITTASTFGYDVCRVIFSGPRPG